MRLAINITDVNDKIYVAARRAGRPVGAAGRRRWPTPIARTPARSASAGPTQSRSRARRSPRSSTLIERLVEHGAAYASDDGDVYFSVEAYPQYGELSGQRPDELIAGSRVEPGEGKRSPLDFALWKANKPDEDTAWDSPWGRGRPGWHIECSAMARAQLGEDFDVHGGGLDLIFPHHENERAQSEAAGERFARVWMHNGMLRLTGEKMSKSLGNIDGLAEALERVGRETLLVFFAQAHYRSPVDYSDTTLEQASATAAGLREALRNARRYAGGSAGSDPPPAVGRRGVRALRRLHGRRSRHAASAGGAARASRATSTSPWPRARRPRPPWRHRPICWCARWTFSASPRSTVATETSARRSHSPRNARMRAQQAILRLRTSCATASQRSDSRFATPRRGRRSCPSMS